MRHIRVSIEVSAAADEVWSLLTEFDQWPKWDPTVVDVESEATRVAPGVTGRVKTIAGPWIPFEITEVEQRQSWTWKVAGMHATGHAVAAVGYARTLVEFSVPIAFMPYAVVLRAGLRRLQRLAEPDAAQPPRSPTSLNPRSPTATRSAPPPAWRRRRRVP